MPKKVKRARRHPQARRLSTGAGRKKALKTARKSTSKVAAKTGRNGGETAALSDKLKTSRAELRAAKAYIAELERRADTDFLADVLNRRGFERELRRAMAYAKRYGANAALVYVDVNGLKPVNDRYGHAAGDAVLKAVARVLVDNVRMSDIVARLGGDEFGVLLWNLSERDAALKTAAIEQAVANERVVIAEENVAVTAAAGFTMLWPADDPQQIVDRADQAMYARKRELRNGGKVTR